ncbi:MAG: hypothetical protein K2G36_07915 [Ruminococcus sp.]|nr:hypothetical protein [Ruminococcus sp.]
MNHLHKSYMEKFITLKELYRKYDFLTLLFETYNDIMNIKDFKVNVPLVGVPAKVH